MNVLKQVFNSRVKVSKILKTERKSAKGIGTVLNYSFRLLAEIMELSEGIAKRAIINRQRNR